MFFEWTQVYISSKHHHVLHDLKTKNHRFSLKNTLTVPLTPWPSSSWFAPKAHQAPGTAPCNKGKVPPRPGSPRRFWRNLSRNGVVVISKLDQILIEKCCIQLCRFVQIVFFPCIQLCIQLIRISNSIINSKNPGSCAEDSLGKDWIRMNMLSCSESLKLLLREKIERRSCTVVQFGWMCVMSPGKIGKACKSIWQ